MFRGVLADDGRGNGEGGIMILGDCGLARGSPAMWDGRDSVEPVDAVEIDVDESVEVLRDREGCCGATKVPEGVAALGCLPRPVPWAASSDGLNVFSLLGNREVDPLVVGGLIKRGECDFK